MPKHLPVEARIKAMELYIEGGKSAKDIAFEVSTTMNVSVKPVTIYACVKQYNWKEI